MENREYASWKSLELLDTLLALADAGHSHAVMEMFQVCWKPPRLDELGSLYKKNHVLGSKDALPRRSDLRADPDQPSAHELPDGGAGADAADLPGEPPQLGRHPQLRLALHHAQPQGRRHARHGGVVQELAGNLKL